MFDAVIRSTSGPISLAKALVIVGNHHTASMQLARVERNRLADPQIPLEVWGPSEPGYPTLGPILAGLVESSFWAGETLTTGDPATDWSPAGSLRQDHLGRFISNDQLVTARSGIVSPVQVLDASSALPVLAFGDDAGPSAAVAFGSDAFVLPVPAGTDFIDIDTRPDLSEVRQEHRAVSIALQAQLAAKVRTFLLWQLHTGPNSLHLTGISEGSGPWRRIRLGGTRAGGYLVGRVAMGVYKYTRRPRRDPFAVRRRIQRELSNGHLARECPNLQLVQKPLPVAVVAVHGTMNTAIPMAARLRPFIRDGIPLLRFEHDTWLPIGENGNALANEALRIGIRRVLLVAHSRGGLVADLAAAKLQAAGVACELITMGTPFQGTPIVGAVKGGLLGARTLIGALRMAPGTGPIIDHGTRWLGFLIRGDLPRGLTAMEPKSDYLHGRAPNWFDAHRFGGNADPAGVDDSWGIHFLDGLAHPAFSTSESHDLVVSTQSALNLDAGAVAPAVSSSDHFSYLLQPEIIDFITTRANDLPGQHVVTAEEPVWLAGQRAGHSERVGDALNW